MSDYVPKSELSTIETLGLLIKKQLNSKEDLTEQNLQLFLKAIKEEVEKEVNN